MGPTGSANTPAGANFRRMRYRPVPMPESPFAASSRALAGHDSALASAALGRLAGILGEDAIFVLGSGTRDAKEALDGVLQRRGPAYAAALQGQLHARMTEGFDAWFVEMVRALAPMSPPTSVPMMGVIRERVTLEIGARGLRSLFSNKPSDKDVARVKRYGAARGSRAARRAGRRRLSRRRGVPHDRRGRRLAGSARRGRERAPLRGADARRGARRLRRDGPRASRAPSCAARGSPPRPTTIDPARGERHSRRGRGRWASPPTTSKRPGVRRGRSSTGAARRAPPRSTASATCCPIECPGLGVPARGAHRDDHAAASLARRGARAGGAGARR